MVVAFLGSLTYVRSSCVRVRLFCLFCRPCALSSFSRNRPHVVEAELSLPSTEYDHFLCRKAVRVRDPAGSTTAARSRGIGRIAPTATRTALDDIAALRDWFRDRFLPAKTDDSAQDATKTAPPHSSTPHDHHTQEPSASSSSSELIGTVVLAERGQCLFEDKAVLAEKAGALALIVQNNEVRSTVCSCTGGGSGDPLLHICLRACFVCLSVSLSLFLLRRTRCL